MAILKNKTQSNFTMISNNILKDRELSLKDRGLFCTLSSLPDGWNFSVAGLSSILPDGKNAISTAMAHLEKCGYLERNVIRGEKGTYQSLIEIFPEKNNSSDIPLEESHDRKSDTDNPLRINGSGLSVTDNMTQYNTDNTKLGNNTDNIIPINQSDKEEDQMEQIERYRSLIADNIKLDYLLDSASRKGPEEIDMVNEIYDVICDMVCVPRDEVVIKGTTYPWQVVKAQFLKLKHRHIADILNRIVDADLKIKNMHSYLITTLYMATLGGTLKEEADMHDDYLKYLRGNPY